MDWPARMSEEGHLRPYATADDASLMRLAAQDDGAFAELYRRYANRVFRYLLRYAPDVDTAADLTQHVFVQCLRSLPRYEDRSLPVAAWIFRIARNAATDAARRRRRMIAWDCSYDESLAVPGPEDEVMRQELRAQLRGAVARLPAPQQELLALRFAGDLTIAEIAALLNKREPAVRKQIRRIVRALRDEFHGL